MTAAMNIKQMARLAQITTEDQVSRKNIRKAVEQDIVFSFEQESNKKDNLVNKYDACTAAIDAYLNKPGYYQSKQARVDLLKSEMLPDDIAAEVIVAVVFTADNTWIPIQSIAAILAKNLRITYPGIFDAIKTAAELLAVCVDTGIMDIAPDPLRVKALIQLEQDTLVFIENTMYLPPLVTRPNAWRNNHFGGHLSINEKVLLGKSNHDLPVCLDVLNILQNIEYELDTRLLQVPEKPTFELDTIQKKTSWEIFVAASNNVYEYLINNQNRFWLTWKIDFRGRHYNCGYHVHLQSTGYKKAMLNFRQKEVIQ
jgi:hypothetical protein